ncbi:hypothetical protein KO498_15135 [Lentibacter algarum]|uniref:COG3904 family protein n=1 Tax=Lentibacter algarum TaxID=576131 RepID=UPI001C08A338|nr:hypothetical protein [Lentibacter algarum]MBU2983142.1 hypothetical protein [Lentibacter algarum]
MRYLPQIDAKSGLKYVLLLQLALAGLLIATQIFGIMPKLYEEKVELPNGPVSPGDQRREYRTDRSLPGLVTQDGPADLSMPDKFDNRLRFEVMVVEGKGNVLLVTGQIDEGAAQRFEEQLADMPAKPDLIALHSPGGLVQEAQQIGRTIRVKELPTAVLKGGVCASSCPYVLAGGLDRAVSRQGIVGLHQHYYDQPGYMPVMFAVESIQTGQGETMEYLVEMGVDPSIMVYSLKTPPEQIYALVEEELIETRIATKIVD